MYMYKTAVPLEAKLPKRSVYKAKAQLDCHTLSIPLTDGLLLHDGGNGEDVLPADLWRVGPVDRHLTFATPIVDELLLHAGRHTGALKDRDTVHAGNQHNLRQSSMSLDVY